jgi:transposase
VLRYRNLVVRQATRVKNRIAGLLMETGAPYNKERLHGRAYFSELLGSLRDVPRSVVERLKLSRGQLEFFAAIQRRLLKGLGEHPDLSERVTRLESIPGVGEIMALRWALEVGEVARSPSIGQAASYCGLTSAQHNSAGKEQRGPISKQRNKHLQTMLIEAAKLAPRYLFPPGFGKSQLVFNLHRAVREAAGCAIVVEGFFDCLRVHQAGYRNVVALMGARLSEVQDHWKSHGSCVG